MKKYKALLSNLLFISIFIILIIIVYYPVFFKDYWAVNVSDAFHLHIPLNYIVAENFKNFHIPLWNPYFNLGQPIIDGSTLIFHPGIIFYLLFSPFWANTMEILIGLLLACLGTWCFLRHLGFRNYSAFIGSIAYIFSGPVFFQHSYHLGFMAVLLLPWSLLVFHQYDKTGSLRYLWISAFLCVLAIHSLDADLLFYLYMGFIIDRVICIPRFRQRIYIYKWIGIFLFSGLTGLLWYLPLSEWIKYSSRGVHSYVGVLTPNFLNLLFAIFTNHWLTDWPYDVFYFYLGPAIIWLVVIGLTSLEGKSYISKYFKGSLIIPGFYILIRIIQYNYSTFLNSIDPWRSMLVFCFSLSLIISNGAEKITKMVNSQQKLSLFLGIFSIVLSVITKGYGMNIEVWLPLMITGGAILLTATGFIYLRKLGIFLALMGSLIIPAINYVKDGEFCIRPREPTDGMVEFYRFLYEKTDARNKHWRISVFNGTDNITVLSKFKSVPNYTSLYNKKFESTFSSDGLIKVNKVQPYWMVLKSSDAYKLSYYGVKYLILDTAATWSKWNQFQPEFTLQGWIKREDLSWPEFQVWENRYYIGRAYIVSSSGERRGGVKFLEDMSESVVLELEANEGDRLVLADLYYPGWEVIVDGSRKVTEIYHGCLRSIKLSQGKHIVKWKYKGKIQRYGLVLSEIMFLLLLIFLTIISVVKMNE